MIRLLLVFSILGIAFFSGIKVAHEWYQVKILKEKALFLEDQAKKKQMAQEEINRIEQEGRTADVDLQKKLDKAIKGVPKHVSSDSRVVLPSTWMRELSRIR